MRYVDFDNLHKNIKKAKVCEKRVKCVRYLRKEKCVFRKLFFIKFNENVKHKKK